MRNRPLSFFLILYRSKFIGAVYLLLHRQLSEGDSIGRAGATVSAHPQAEQWSKPISNAHGLRWRRAQGLVNPAEIVMRDIQRDRRSISGTN
jgi:hypothetical protein